MHNFLSIIVIAFTVTETPSPISPITNAPTGLEWLGPAVSVIGGVMVALIGGISLIWRRRQDRKEAIADKQADTESAIRPKVTDGWEEVRAARLETSMYYNLYRTFENLFYTVFSALRHLARVTRDTNPETVFEKDITDALAVVPPETTVNKK